MARQLFILTVSLILTAVTVFGQTVNIDKWKIKPLKIHTITETTIFNPDSLKPDTFITYMTLYDTNARVIEKRYYYERVSLTPKDYHYESLIYKYDENGNNTSALIVNKWSLGVGIREPSQEYFFGETNNKSAQIKECKYFDTNGNVLKTELAKANGANQTAIYSYKEFKYTDSDWESTDFTTKLPIQIVYYYKDKLDRKVIINYAFY